MPLKLSIGLSRKLGLPGYSSVGAQCGLEIELDSTLLKDHPDRLSEQIQSAYTSCRKAVDDELVRSRSAGDTDRLATVTGNAGETDDHRNGNGHNGNGAGARPATNRQLNFIRRLVCQIDGPGPRSLEDLSARILGKAADELTSQDASVLIHRLQNMRDGIIDLTAADTPCP
jgi:hypothetical protein